MYAVNKLEQQCALYRRDSGRYLEYAGEKVWCQSSMGWLRYHGFCCIFYNYVGTMGYRIICK